MPAIPAAKFGDGDAVRDRWRGLDRSHASPKLCLRLCSREPVAGSIAAFDAELPLDATPVRMPRAVPRLIAGAVDAREESAGAVAPARIFRFVHQVLPAGPCPR